jgi:hypothetical protein
MRLILHIGTEKTGSTAIQQHLLENRDSLTARGVRVCESLGSGNHRALVAAFMPVGAEDDYLRALAFDSEEARAAWRSETLDAFRKEVDAARDACDTLVVSSEHFHSRLLQPVSVQALADFLQPLFRDIEVLVYLRRQDEMALSFYSEKLRAGYVPPDILPLRNVQRRKAGLPPYFDFEGLLDRWASAFGEANVSPRLYQRERFTGGDVVSDFFAAAGLGAVVSRLPRAANPALSSAAQAALRLFNQRCGGNDVAVRDRHRATRHALVAHLQAQDAGDRGVLPVADEAEAFHTAFSASNARVAQRWFGREALFPEDFSSYPDAAPVTDWAAAAELLADFLAARDRPGADG